MYLIAHVRKFVRDNRKILGKEARQILQRAEKAAYNSGMFLSCDVEDILGNANLAREFRVLAESNMGYLQISMRFVIHQP